MLEKYLPIELMFLLPILLCLSVAIVKRGKPSEIRFLFAAAVVCALIVSINIILGPRTGFIFPAFIFLLLVASAYAIHPSIVLSCAASLLACVAFFAVLLCTHWYADSHRDSFADKVGQLSFAIALLSGMATAVLLQMVSRRLFGKPIA
ncbi:MAG: hypothetical protein ACK58T_44085, partial [Phycisphaerae bacterium]